MFDSSACYNAFFAVLTPLVAIDADVADSITAGLFKIASLIVGLAMCYMGYKLFLTRYQWEATESVFHWKDFAINIKKTAPGTFFVLFGCAVLVETEITFRIDSTTTTSQTTTTTSVTSPHSPIPSASTSVSTPSAQN